MATKSSITAAEAIMRLEPLYQGSISRTIRTGADESLTHLQIQSLFLLNDLGPLAMHEISDKLHMSKQHLTRFVDALVKKGLLMRFQKDNNRRTVYICVTEEGKRALTSYVSFAISTVAEYVDSLSEEDKNAVAAAANRLTEIFEKIRK